MNAHVRRFDSGATRDLDTSKLDYEGFLSPLVLRRYAEYMHANRILPDGSIRASDNWQAGIPKEAYIKSGWRHFFEWWSEHRGIQTKEGIELALCGILFNASGYLHEHLKACGMPELSTSIPSLSIEPGSPDAAVEEMMAPGTPPAAKGDA